MNRLATSVASSNEIRLMAVGVDSMLMTLSLFDRISADTMTHVLEYFSTIVKVFFGFRLQIFDLCEGLMQQR